VAGEPEQLGQVFTPDAVGWSPAWRFSGRDEAVAMLREHASPLLVTKFSVRALSWSPPVLAAVWELEAVHAEAFFVGDDLLVDVVEQPVTVHGVCVAQLRDQRIATLQTYYDEALLIEHVVLAPATGSKHRSVSFPR
jgi:hypothetical protein